MKIKILIVMALLCASCAVQNDPFKTFYSPDSLYGNLATTGSKVTPPVYFYQPANADEQRREDVAIIQLGYVPIGISNFQSTWAQPHRKVGADLVVYQMGYLGTQLMSVPHLTYLPGQSFTRETSGYVGDTYGSFTSYGYSPGTFNTQYTTEQVGQYQHLISYMVERR